MKATSVQDAVGKMSRRRPRCTSGWRPSRRPCASSVSPSPRPTTISWRAFARARPAARRRNRVSPCRSSCSRTARAAFVTLEDVIAEGPTVISFNRGHWCEYCRIELTAFRQGMNEIAAHRASVDLDYAESEVFTGKAAANAGNAFKILIRHRQRLCVDHGAGHLARRPRAQPLSVARPQS